MIKASDDMFEIALGLSEEDYLETVKEAFKDQKELCIKFLNTYKGLTNQQKQLIRTINPISLINNEKDKFSFLYHVMLFDKYKELFSTTINNFKENMQHFSNELCLCSYKISFRHPRTKKKMDFEIDNPFRLT